MSLVHTALSCRYYKRKMIDANQTPNLCTYTYMHIHVHISTYLYVDLYVCTYICMYRAISGSVTSGPIIQCHLLFPHIQIIIYISCFLLIIKFNLLFIYFLIYHFYRSRPFSIISSIHPAFTTFHLCTNQSIVPVRQFH